MGITILYYFLGFIFFICCLGGIQKWFKLPQQKKDKVGLIVVSIFLVALFGFIITIVFKPKYFRADTTISGMIFFIFLFIVFTAFFIFWYNVKYNKKINIATIIIILCLSIFAFIFLIIKNIGSNEKEILIQNIALKTIVTNINFDPHKPYFKDMTLADGQYLPMPEAMNKILQIGDSIYKNKGETFYTIVSATTKTITKVQVKIHERILGKAQ